jgi:hypothetical protein
LARLRSGRGGAAPALESTDQFGHDDEQHERDEQKVECRAEEISVLEDDAILRVGRVSRIALAP